MLVVNSERARRLLKERPHHVGEKTPAMKKFPSERLSLWALVEEEAGVVKNLSYAGELPESAILIIESMASLLIGKKISILTELSVRECEAFLRDRNSVPALENLDPEDEKELKRFFTWLRPGSGSVPVRDYVFPLEKGAFDRLSLVDKVRELKAFLNSTLIVSLYEGRARPELVDVEELTVFVHASYGSDEDRALFEELHELGVRTFREENLNFIPEA